MDEGPLRRADQRVERAIGALLQAGVVLAALVTLVGIVLYLGAEGRRLADSRVFRGEPFDLRSASAIVAGALAGHRDAIVQAGVLILIATPVARVVLSLLAFAVRRDRTYVLVTLAVLAVLLWGLVGIGP
jgi:uncharacterized membrane protein